MAVCRFFKSGQLPYRDALDLDEGVLGQGGDLDAAAGGEAAVKIGAVNLVHGAEIGQILHENRRFDDVVEAQAGLVQDGLQIFEGLVGLGLHAIGQIAGGGIQAELAAALDGGAGVNGLRLGAEGGRGVRGGNVGHSDALLYV